MFFSQCKDKTVHSAVFSTIRVPIGCFLIDNQPSKPIRLTIIIRMTGIQKDFFLTTDNFKDTPGPVRCPAVSYPTVRTDRRWSAVPNAVCRSGSRRSPCKGTIITRQTPSGGTTLYPVPTRRAAVATTPVHATDTRVRPTPYAGAGNPPSVACRAARDRAKRFDNSGTMCPIP